MGTIRIDSLDDPRIQPYRDLKDRELAREGDLFIAEGEHIVRRLLNSDLEVVSVLLAQRREAEMAPVVPAHVPVYIVADDLVHRIVGYRFHSGVLAIGRRPRRIALQEVLPAAPAAAPLVVCPEIANTENLGALIRISAAFGACAMVLGERCCDPYWRQAVRVSMGTVFRLPIVRSQDLRADLLAMRDAHAVELLAAVCDGPAEALADARCGRRFALLFGNEAQGLDRRWLELAQRRITIPMQLGTDSLNVFVAAAVFLYHFTQGAGRSA